MHLDAGEIDVLNDAVAVARLSTERFGNHPLAMAGAANVRDAIHAYIDDMYALEKLARQGMVGGQDLSAIE